MGPVLVFDKSFLQSLNPDEALWLDQFFAVNITPLFFIETLADLEKEVREGRTPEQVVGSLAYKTPDLHSNVNTHHSTLLNGELTGRAFVETTSYLPILPGGRHTKVEGQSGVVFEPAPEERALRRWQNGSFLELEREQAAQWRRSLELLAPERQREFFANWFEGGQPSSLTDVKRAADSFIDGPFRGRALAFGLQLVGLPSAAVSFVIRRWHSAGNPPIRAFAPYFRHVYGVELFFYLGLASRHISERPTNHVDMAYLYYLPFCMVFTSTDRIHRDTVPLFLSDRQTFVWGDDLKRDLAELDRHFDGLPAEVKARGLFDFATYPPLTPRSLVSDLWDRHMSPHWRAQAVAPRPKRDEIQDAALVEAMKRRADAPAVPGPRNSKLDDMDYMLIKRRVALSKGKWRRFPPEVKADNDR